MLTRLSPVVALAALCLGSVGCRSICGGGDCDCGRGRSQAFAKYDCSCDAGCGCGCGQNAEADCGCSASRGREDACGNCCQGGGHPVLSRLCGCTACGELYWNEWHNDPPALCEPCDCLGNYIGPGSPGYYRAPYRRHDGFAGDESPSSVEPLELAEDGEIVR